MRTGILWTIAGVLVMSLPVAASPFHLDLSQRVDQQGFVLDPIEGSVTETPAGTYYQFFAQPGRNGVGYDGHPGGPAGTPFALTITADLAGRGGYQFIVGDHQVVLAHDGPYNQFWVGIYEPGVGYAGTHALDTWNVHTYSVECDGLGDYTVFVDTQPVLTGGGWDNGDLAMTFTGDFTFHAQTATANIYDLHYIPEPASAGLLLAGCVALLRRRRKLT